MMAFVKQHAPRADDQRRALRDFAGLVAELEDAKPVARRRAARCLAEFAEASEVLVARLQREDDASVREAMFTALTQLGDDVAVAGLVGCLRSEDVGLRNEAVDVMKALPDQVAPIMGQLLADPDSDVRILAINILESLRHPQVEAWLIDVILRDPHINVCSTALDLLGEVGSEAAADALVRLKARFPGEPYVLFAADLALQRICGA